MLEQIDLTKKMGRKELNDQYYARIKVLKSVVEALEKRMEKEKAE